MSGRGRNRGGLSFNMEQLNIPKNTEIPLVIHPPPKFPPLEYKPLPFTMTKELNFIVEVKEQFKEYMNNSENIVAPIAIKKDIERFSDHYEYLDGLSKKNYESRYDWSRMPHELKLKREGQSKDNKGSKKRRKDVNIDKKLQELESKESNEGSDGDDVKEEEDDDDDEEVNKQLDGDEEEQDEEMDLGTDYYNSYFDNGEGFDEDDNDADNEPVF